MLSYNELNNRAHTVLYDSMFFQNWKNKNPNTALEIILTTKCNLNCEYCYFAKHGEELYPSNLMNDDIILANINRILYWLQKNDYHPDLDLFSGEFFAQQLGWDVLELVTSFYENNLETRRPKFISISSNFSFIGNEELTKKVEDYINRLNKINITLMLSASIDGLLLEDLNRPFKKIDDPIAQTLYVKRDQEWYDKLFVFLKKYNYGLHPMVAPNHIDKWIDNFKWLYSMVEKYEMDPNVIYLLEVRDPNWTDQNIQDFKKFIHFLMDTAWDMAGHDPKKFANTVYRKPIRGKFNPGWNILAGSVAGVTDAAKCMIQSLLYVRAADLKIFPCHRQMYSQLLLAELNIDNDYNGSIISNNLAMANAILSFAPNSLPMCHKCAINEICGTQCYGSCYETNKEPFAPIPSVCRLEAIKIYAIAEKIKEYKAYTAIVPLITRPAAIQLGEIIGGLQ